MIHTTRGRRPRTIGSNTLSRAFPRPGYPQQGYPPPGYPQRGYPPPGYPQQGYPAPPPPGHLGWAITAIILFWPLAIPAFINYGRVESSWYRGDQAGAYRSSANVKKFGVIALCLGIALALICIIFAMARRRVWP